jgi:hypothetical protein
VLRIARLVSANGATNQAGYVVLCDRVCSALIRAF